jgi:hypothetical protein
VVQEILHNAYTVANAAARCLSVSALYGLPHDPANLAHTRRGFVLPNPFTNRVAWCRGGKLSCARSLRHYHGVPLHVLGLNPKYARDLHRSAPRIGSRR